MIPSMHKRIQTVIKSQVDELGTDSWHLLGLPCRSSVLWIYPFRIDPNTSCICFEMLLVIPDTTLPPNSLEIHRVVGFWPTGVTSAETPQPITISAKVISWSPTPNSSSRFLLKEELCLRKNGFPGLRKVPPSLLRPLSGWIFVIISLIRVRTFRMCTVSGQRRRFTYSATTLKPKWAPLFASPTCTIIPKRLYSTWVIVKLISIVYTSTALNFPHYKKLTAMLITIKFPIEQSGSNTRKLFAPIFNHSDAILYEFTRECFLLSKILSLAL